jgi:Fe-S cluster biogenesis protein NfuA
METYNREEMYKRNVNLYMESNPNPNSLKFVANYMLVEPGKSYDFPNAESAEDAPLAQALFDFDYVERVFYMSNFITVTKTAEVEWAAVQGEIKQFITDYLQQEKPLLQAEEIEDQDQTELSTDGLEQKIIGVLEEYVKPAVEMDGGAIQFHSFQDGVVTVLLQGACSGCPSSTITLKSGIENLLKSMVPEVQEVVAEGV